MQAIVYLRSCLHFRKPRSVSKRPIPVLRFPKMATKKTQNAAPTGKLVKRLPRPEAQKKVGRPRAKHSDPNYVQMSVYIHKDVRTKVKVRLLDSGGEFSGLVESLLRDWLSNK
jgi:hypothetical protein